MVNQQPEKQGIWRTLISALLLRRSFYKRACNTIANRQIALTIVCLAALSHALGSVVILLINRVSVVPLVVLVLLNTLGVLIGYYFWTFTIWKIGQWLKPADPTYQDLLNPIGFAYAPQVLNFLTLIPLLGRPIELILAVWSLLAVTVAVRQALDLRSWQAAVICLLGWPVIQLAIGSIQVMEQQLFGQTPQ